MLGDVGGPYWPPFGSVGFVRVAGERWGLGNMAISCVVTKPDARNFVTRMGSTVDNTYRLKRFHVALGCIAM